MSNIKPKAILTLQKMTAFKKKQDHKGNTEWAIWHSKNPYVLSFLVTEGECAVQDHVALKDHEIGNKNNKPVVYLGMISKIEKDNKSIQKAIKNDFITLEIIHEAWKEKEYDAKYICSLFHSNQFSVMGKI